MNLLMKIFFTLFVLFFSSFVFANQCTSGDCKNGYGTFEWDDGTKYTGDHKNNVAEGKGSLTFSDGSKYEGEFKNDKFHGKGKFYYEDGTTYEGDFKNDKMTGQGTIIWISGEKYIGEVKNELMHGEGTLFFPEGDKYVGEFKKDQFHGKGSYFHNDGRIEKGTWKKNDLVKGGFVKKENEIVDQDNVASNNNLNNESKNIDKQSIEENPFSIISTAFNDGEIIPKKYGCKYNGGDNISIPLKFSNIPNEAKSLALIIDDPDAKSVAGKIWVHWIITDIPVDTKEIAEVKDGKINLGKTGKNSNGDKNYGGPCPPNGFHLYNIKAYALNSKIKKNLNEMTQIKFEKKYKNIIISSSKISGKYK